MRRMKPLRFSLEEMAGLLRVVDSDEADAGEVPATEEVLDSFIAQAGAARRVIAVSGIERHCAG